MSVIITTSMARLARQMRFHASAGDYTYDGRNVSTPYFEKAKRLHVETGTLLLFTRDQGAHSSGWFKNPDWERCFHLSISFWDVEQGLPRPFEPLQAEAWVRAFYGEWMRYVQTEGTKLPPERRSVDVKHYRVRCDEHWQPIIPRGEVYTKTNTPSDWKSWSEQQGDMAKDVWGTEE